MDQLLERFLRYVKIDTQSDETSTSVPSTEKQLDLCRLLEGECRELGLQDVTLAPSGTVMATVPATVEHTAPAIGLVAHVDTSPEYSGTNVNPQVHANYQGGDIVLPGDTTKVITVEENPALNDLIGGTIVTSDGTTLLGSDDKSGVAVIMTAAAELMAHPEIPHGPVRVCFTCDEEIGRGVDHLNIDEFGVICAYTLDGDTRGKIDSETFSADQAIVTVQGKNTHPSVGKGVMINSLRIISHFLARLPEQTDSPETTDDREGFIHPYDLEGGVDRSQAKLILRDFETEKLSEYADRLKALATELEGEYPGSTIEVVIKQQYRNMREGLKQEPRALTKAIEATRNAGMEPQQAIVRGGTDGSILTAKGLPTPNLSTGEHNPHSPLEWTSVEEMQAAVNVLIELAKLWGEERV